MNAPIIFVRVDLLGVIAGAKEIVAEADQVIVDPAAVEGKEAHQCYHVPHSGECLEGRIHYPVVIDDQVQAQAKEHETVADVPEHDSKEEGEGDGGENRGIYFLVSRHAVRIRYLLGNAGVAVSSERCRWVAQAHLLQGGGRRHPV